MTLEAYLKRTATSTREFADKLGTSVHAVRKWRQRTRIPRAAMLAKIKKATKGEVSAADWYQ